LEENYEFREEIYKSSSKSAFTRESFKLCATCHNYIKAGRKPKGAISNGLDFPKIPHSLRGLTPLKERLIFPRLPFMIIISLGHERQSAIKGAVVNVPIPLSNIVAPLLSMRLRLYTSTSRDEWNMDMLYWQRPLGLLKLLTLLDTYLIPSFSSFKLPSRSRDALPSFPLHRSPAPSPNRHIGP